MFDIQRVETEWAGRKLVLETGKIARQADGAVLVSYGETIVLCTVRSSDLTVSRSAPPRTIASGPRIEVTWLLRNSFLRIVFSLQMRPFPLPQPKRRCPSPVIGKVTVKPETGSPR